MTTNAARTSQNKGREEGGDGGFVGVGFTSYLIIYTLTFIRYALSTYFNKL